jgi:hypothetical protein
MESHQHQRQRQHVEVEVMEDDLADWKLGGVLVRRDSDYGSVGGADEDVNVGGACNGALMATFAHQHHAYGYDHGYSYGYGYDREYTQ